jgi:hypothetical protein
MHILYTNAPLKIRISTSSGVTIIHAYGTLLRAMPNISCAQAFPACIQFFAGPECSQFFPRPALSCAPGSWVLTVLAWRQFGPNPPTSTVRVSPSSPVTDRTMNPAFYFPTARSSTQAEPLKPPPTAPLRFPSTLPPVPGSSWP